MVIVNYLNQWGLKVPLYNFCKDLISGIEDIDKFPICQLQSIPFLKQQRDEPTCDTFGNQLHASDSFTVVVMSALMKLQYALKKSTMSPFGPAFFPLTRA